MIIIVGQYMGINEKVVVGGGPKIVFRGLLCKAGMEPPVGG